MTGPTTRRRPGDDPLRSQAGAASAEYVAAALVVAALVASVIAIGLDDTTSEAGTVAVDCLFDQAGDCDPVAAAGSDSDGTGDHGGGDDAGASADDRRDAAGDARGDRRDRGRDDDTQVPPDLPDDTAPPEVLGDPVDGTSAEVPDPPPWEPVDPGAGEHDAESPSLRTRAAEVVAEIGANGLAGSWPDASRNLLHFLGNSGDTLEQDVDKLLGDVDEFATEVDGRRNQLGALAVERAREAGADGPVTFPLSTDWIGWGYDNGQLAYDDDNWFYALGGWQYAVIGTVTATPPSTPGGEWTWSMSSSVHLRDQYNWDGTKATPIGPLTVTDEELARMHRAGLAQEYTNVGESEVTTTEGRVP